MTPSGRIGYSWALRFAKLFIDTKLFVAGFVVGFFTALLIADLVLIADFVLIALPSSP